MSIFISHCRHAILCLSFLTLNLGCGSPEQASFVELEGIFRVYEHSSSENSCSPSDALPNEKDAPEHLIVIQQNVAGEAMFRAVLCDALEVCILMKDALEQGENIPTAKINILLTERFPTGARGSEQSSGFTTSTGVCEKPQRIDNELQFSGQDTLELSRRLTMGIDYPETEDGFCTTQAGAEAVQGQPCSGLTIIRGRRVL